MYSNQMTDKMDENFLNKIVSALTEGRHIGCNSSNEKLNFCVEETLAPTDIKVTVNEAEELSFPLSKASVQKLINVSKFGSDEKTAFDNNCNTQMIDDWNDLVVTINPKAVSRITNNIKKAFDFPTGSTLTPHLYNMSIHGPGHFFYKPRNSEKLQNILATLVIILPSPHIGGDLVIEHDKKKCTISSQNVGKDNAKCIYFYSDCLHYVNEVQDGYRVALIFNIVRKTGELSDVLPCTNERLKTAVRDYFNTKIVEDRPKKIIFFLNHMYSANSLLWDMLKGEDCHYASSFRSVARELDLDIYLASANIHQKWSSANQYEAIPDRLIETYSTLTCWVDENNVKVRNAEEYSATESEICLARDTHYENFYPIDGKFFLSTDDARATVDYWYKRAAIVLWQKSDSLMAKFEMNYDEAMAEVRALISVPGNETNVTEILKRGNKISQKKGRPTENDFETFVKVALYVKAEKEAQEFLLPFHLDVLIPENARLFAQLQQQYGIDWLITLIASLQEYSNSGYSFDSMDSEAINPFIHELLNSKCDRSVIKSLLRAEIKTFKKSVECNIALNYSKIKDVEKPRELFKACVAIECAELQKNLADYLISELKLFPRSELVKLYHEFQEILSPESSELLRAGLEQDIKRELSSQTLDVDDWSLSEVLCNCEHCKVLNDFLLSKTIKTKVWPVDKKIREHVKSILKFAKASVEVKVDSNTRPYSLVLEKNIMLSTKKYTELQAMLQNFQPKSAAKKRDSLMESGEEKRKKF